MPRKIRELETDLIKAGFDKRTGKGSHRVYTHPKTQKVVVISGKPGDDAKRYQEKEVKDATEE